MSCWKIHRACTSANLPKELGPRVYANRSPPCANSMLIARYSLVRNTCIYSNNGYTTMNDTDNNNNNHEDNDSNDKSFSSIWQSCTPRVISRLLLSLCLCAHASVSCANSRHFGQMLHISPRVTYAIAVLSTASGITLKCKGNKYLQHWKKVVNPVVSNASV